MKEILDLDSGSAITIFSSVKIPRNNPQEEFGMIDLENYISQAIWKLFDTSREEVIERLSIEEADLILADARIMGIKIDGNQVVNPQGFTGKNLEILLGITMVRRDKFIEEMQIFEGGSVRGYLLAKEVGFDDAVYIEVGNRKTTMFSIASDGISFMNDFDWGSNQIIHSLKEAFGIQPFSAAGIYERHAGNRLSEHMTKRADKIFYDSLTEFVNGIASGIRGGISGKGKLPPIYLRTFFPTPEGIHRKRFAIGSKQLRFLPAVGNSDLAAFLDDDVHEIYGELNQLAKRRIKWLMPTV
jgi:hypothetical protein